MKVGFVQFDCRFGEVEKNTDRAAEWITRQRADLWVLPELFNTSYQFTSKKEVAALAEPVPSGPTTQRLIRLAKENRTHLVAGLAERSGKQFYNSSVLVGPKGLLSVYRKIHLFYEETRWFTPGNLRFQVHPVGKARVGMMICFDWFFPEAARSLALLGADIIAHPSNLVLPYCPDAMPTRCLENRLFAITANRVGSESRGKETLTYIGMSEVVDPKGRILYRASDRKEESHVVEIDPKLARNKSLNRYNHLLKDRRDRLYVKS
ncbi:nitrilase-related carbon-nitrogen hydrolase [Candidatus Manganitrophus noduliformans]|uniref:Acyltransferase n=1 Tax=Candidatus Manganitrophus noduliformans TaxID=2606439 RepID=A0A7X6IC88_9BACT|nr:nitrilase-related carbon-nitrogen hydrolase [Candidatus Manganitrophus noduliformans]NKE72581.1 acyltransferase [Candidatus Manganitrophus noduliformans]